MGYNRKSVCVAIVCCAAVLNSTAQINLKSNQITFREHANSARNTTHYGDLTLNGGSSGSTYGWLYCNRIECNDDIRTWENLWVVGDLSVCGDKNFIHPHPTDTTRMIRYITVESGEAVTMTRGISKTNNGSVVVALPEHFGLVTSGDAPLTVILTPEKAPVLLYTAEKSKERITVVMKPADFREFGDVEFSWQACGVRDGHEDVEPIVDAETLFNGNEDKTPVSEKRAKLNDRIRKMTEKFKDSEKARK